MSKKLFNSLSPSKLVSRYVKAFSSFISASEITFKLTTGRHRILCWDSQIESRASKDLFEIGFIYL